MVLAPYILVAPRLFADQCSERITLGTLVQTSNSFDKVFASLSVISENWCATLPRRVPHRHGRRARPRVPEGRDELAHAPL